MRSRRSWTERLRAELVLALGEQGRGDRGRIDDEIRWSTRPRLTLAPQWPICAGCCRFDPREPARPAHRHRPRRRRERSPVQAVAAGWTDPRCQPCCRCSRTSVSPWSTNGRSSSARPLRMRRGCTTSAFAHRRASRSTRRGGPSSRAASPTSCGGEIENDGLNRLVLCGRDAGWAVRDPRLCEIPPPDRVPVQPTDDRVDTRAPRRRRRCWPSCSNAGSIPCSRSSGMSGSKRCGSSWRRRSTGPESRRRPHHAGRAVTDPGDHADERLSPGG